MSQYEETGLSNRIHWRVSRTTTRSRAHSSSGQHFVSRQDFSRPWPQFSRKPAKIHAAPFLFTSASRGHRSPGNPVVTGRRLEISRCFTPESASERADHRFVPIARYTGRPPTAVTHYYRGHGTLILSETFHGKAQHDLVLMEAVLDKLFA